MLRGELASVAGWEGIMEPLDFPGYSDFGSPFLGKFTKEEFSDNIPNVGLLGPRYKEISFQVMEFVISSTLHINLSSLWFSIAYMSEGIVWLNISNDELL